MASAIEFYQTRQMPFWIETVSPLKLAIVPRPGGGEWLTEDIRQLRSEGIDILVSLLAPEEMRELDLEHEAAACASAGISFVNFPLPEHQVPPSRHGFLTFAQMLHRRASEGLSVGVHCRECIGRSAVLLATLLRLQGFSAKDALERISAARGLRVPGTAEQARWVAGLAI
ncbi:MAG TPA: protein-tyrosine phosphatase family protein [Acidobacteriaceae bacterium]